MQMIFKKLAGIGKIWYFTTEFGHGDAEPSVFFNSTLA